MSDKRQKGVPYGYSTTATSTGGAGKGIYVIGAVVALVVLAGIVALVVSSEGGGEDQIEAVQEQGPMDAEGAALPPYPADAGLVADPGTDPAVGMAAPALSGEDFGGNGVPIEPGNGTPKVLVFAAHWCPHCQKEIPLIQDWIDEGNLPEGVEIVLVNTGVKASENNYPPSEWLSSVGWSETIVLDDPDQTASQAYGLGGYPYMVFIDGEGKVVQRASGELPIDQFAGFVEALV